MSFVTFLLLAFVVSEAFYEREMSRMRRWLCCRGLSEWRWHIIPRTHAALVCAGVLIFLQRLIEAHGLWQLLEQAA